jgi:tripartite-type tricarboxylate transporter receptor subunit TctC
VNGLEACTGVNPGQKNQCNHQPTLETTMNPRVPISASLRTALKLVTAFSFAFASLFSASAVMAQSYPTRPVKIVVAFPPGGVADVWARSIAPSLQESLGQPVVVENRSGANGNVAAESVAKSPGDGYTFVLSTTGIETVNHLILPKTSFDAGKVLKPVAVLGDIKLFLVTRPALPPASVKDFVSYAKANIGKLSYGSAGSGSTPHLAGELFKQSAGVFATHIPYRGAAPALQDLLASQIDFFFDPGISFPHVRSGRLKMLAVASGTRSVLFPDVPTLTELGIKEVEADTIFGLWAPASTPDDIVNRVHREVNKALSLPATRQRFNSVGGDATPLSIADFKAKIRAEGLRFGAIIKSRNIQAD